MPTLACALTATLALLWSPGFIHADESLLSRTYTVVAEKDVSVGARYRVTLGIEADDATTDRAQIETMMKAAVEYHRQSWPAVIFVQYWDNYANGDGWPITNAIAYAVDGCGWTGDPCTRELWSDVLQGEIPAHLMAWGAPTEDELEASKDLRCRHDLQCWGDKHHMEATFACQPLIESRAKYTYDWTDGWLGSKFEKIMWDDWKIRTLLYGGDSVRFQNGFGAWQNMAYWCKYNPATGGAELTVLN